jgi:hypothetical protein
MSDTKSIRLKKPVKHGEDMIEVIDLREPVAADYAKCGYPISIGDKERAFPDADAILSLIVRCGKVPRNVAERLCAEDFNACLRALMHFFGDAADQE